MSLNPGADMDDVTYLPRSYQSHIEGIEGIEGIEDIEGIRHRA